MRIVLRRDNLNRLRVDMGKNAIRNVMNSDRRLWRAEELGRVGNFIGRHTARKYAIEVALELGWRSDNFDGRDFVFPPEMKESEVLDQLRRIGREKRQESDNSSGS